MKNFTKLILLTALLLSSTYGENNATQSTTDDAMKKIDSVEEDILSSLEADAQQDTNSTKKNK